MFRLYYRLDTYRIDQPDLQAVRQHQAPLVTCCDDLIHTKYPCRILLPVFGQVPFACGFSLLNSMMSLSSGARIQLTYFVQRATLVLSFPFFARPLVLYLSPGDKRLYCDRPRRPQVRAPGDCIFLFLILGPSRLPELVYRYLSDWDAVE